LTAHVEAFFDQATFTVSYVLSDADTGKAAIIDSLLDYDAAAGRTSTTSADRVIAWVRDQGLSVEYILETHVHADHITAAPYLRQALGGKIVIGAWVSVVQEFFATAFNVAGDFAQDGSQFDLLLDDCDILALGGLEIRALHTPGHTPACMTYLVADPGSESSSADCAFIGDTLFMPDYGSARCDFPGGDAALLYRSVQKILALPGDTTLYLCHDYGGENREYAWVTTVAEQKEKNIHLRDGISEGEFVAMREARDKTLGMPALILPAVQINMRAGEMPPAEDDGVAYLKIPLNIF
jgi:glyoxylase-like metal-dependent hydrolase (beta-lactamase superfamily II)